MEKTDLSSRLLYFRGGALLQFVFRAGKGGGRRGENNFRPEGKVARRNQPDAPRGWPRAMVTRERE